MHACAGGGGRRRVVPLPAHVLPSALSALSVTERRAAATRGVSALWPPAGLLLSSSPLSHSRKGRGVEEEAAAQRTANRFRDSQSDSTPQFSRRRSSCHSLSIAGAQRAEGLHTSPSNPPSMAGHSHIRQSRVT
ncbi:hypothetical protein SKAU_G00400750 [Synaphobranchus kaupii]|uniref:Uncharacterized protein n=1 Tax=Synaphobranchus kaupii TaxID=118154 RepID=A0A9Q1E8Z6_SYNKA|nr:hypothetical protein SKAU_G00400750 [Synaphobranchus kaupii]